jgi:thioredoxin-related protein/tetratricopeptide (TPR) repeat protein
MMRLLVVLGMALWVGVAAAATSGSAPKDGIAWFDGDVDAAFAQARRERKPLFLYWGAVWCPPCNQVKVTIFNRQDFISRSRSFVPVYIDGDTPSAQALASRFKVSGYPTMVLFRPDGTEVTRLPGEVEAEQYMRVLTLGMHATRPVSALLSAVQTGKSTLTPADWRLLAYYSWETDEQAVVPKAKVAGTLAQLAQACPPQQAAARSRLTLKAVAAASDLPENERMFDRGAAFAQLEAVLADPALARENFSSLTDSAGDLAKALAITPAERARLFKSWDPLLQRWSDDATLSRADRLSAVNGRIELARVDAGDDGALPAQLQNDVRFAARRAERETTDKYERQAVISAAAYVLREAGLMDEADTMLKAELNRSHSPYYLMLGLASNARKRGDIDAALDWYSKAFDASQGPATRLEWGVRYVRALLDLAPQDPQRIEWSTRNVIGELDAKPETFHGRSANVLTTMGQRVREWTENNNEPDLLARLRETMDAVCARLPESAPERATCNGVFAGAKGPAA